MSARNVVRLARRSLAARGGRSSGARKYSTQEESLPKIPNTQYTAVTHPEDPASIPASVKALLDKSDSYILPVYARPPFVLSHGKGTYVWDTEGRKYLDFSAGIAVNALGHADEGVAQVLADEAGKLLHTSNAYHHQWSAKLAELLVTLTQQQGGLGSATGSAASSAGAKVFFSNSGTEANEGALKVARKVGKMRWAEKNGRSWDDPACDKFEIVCFENAFHGRSMGALSVTTNPKYQQPFAPLIPGVKVGKFNVKEDVEGLVTDTTCAVIVEPVQGEGGIHFADEEFLRALRARCNETGAVLIYDEIQCGLYRTGKLWAHSNLPVDCHPDIITMAKPLANGYPIGAVLLRDAVAEAMTPGTHGTTFGGSPLACALGFHVLSRVSEEAFVTRVRDTGAYLQGRLARLPKWFPELLQPGVRGTGLILGLGFRDAHHPAKMVALARERGVLILTAGKDAVRFVPSLNISRKEVDAAVDVLESCLSVLSAA